MDLSILSVYFLKCMAQFFTIHPENPQTRLIKQAIQIIKSGGVIVLPTEASYVLACHLDDKAAADRIRSIRGIDEKHLLSLLCADLSELANFARVDNRQYRLLKAVTPGPYVFILEATKQVPRRVSHPSRKTIGLRVPAHPIAIELGQPLLTTTLILPGEEEPLCDPEDIRLQLERQLDLIIDGGLCTAGLSTVLDLSGETPVLVRAGCGSLDAIASQM